MFSPEWIAVLALAYLSLLFFIAYVGDSDSRRIPVRANRNVIYALSLAVYCSSWTFYGAVGTATVRGLDYLAIYFGPTLVFLFGYPLMKRMILICKRDNITTISDFIASRFGKSRRIGVLVTIIAVVGSLPYIALQLQAVSRSYVIMQQQSSVASAVIGPDSIALYTAIILAIFAVLFGTRHLDATEHHRGMVLAIAFESVVKLVAILAIGYYAIYLLLERVEVASLIQIFDLPGGLENSADRQANWLTFTTRTLLAMGAIVLLPRQFQVTIVESEDHRQFKTAIWLMPLYLMLTSIIVLPIALAGSVLLPGVEEDFYVLNLPLITGNEMLGLVAFIGGLSAATGMVIVAAISLSTMICNDWVMPRLIQMRSFDILGTSRLDEIILLVRRLAILVLLTGAYGYYRLMDDNAQLANMGLVSFAAVFQFLPALIAALLWKRAHSKGVFWGLIGGFIVWAYTLLLPTILAPGTINDIWSLNAWLHPQRLFTLDFGDPLTHGVFWSLLVNLGLLAIISIRESQSTLEQMQAHRYFYVDSVGSELHQQAQATPLMVHPDALRILSDRVIGANNTEKVFRQYEKKTGNVVARESQIDSRLLSLVQTAIAGVIGTASAQRVITDTIAGDEEYLERISTLVDESSSLLKFNRKLLETTLQSITHGIAVVDDELNLVIWNERYLNLFEYPENLIYIGKPIKELLEYNAQRGDFGDRDGSEEVRKRMRYLQRRESYQVTRQRSSGITIKSTGEPMPGGGFVTTYEDITESVKSAEALRKANEDLELRVKQRTKELEVLTEELQRITRSKTHFLAAASHDLLQPINAARLFTQSVLERKHDANEVERLANNVDESLETANQLLRALLDVSKLDAGGIKPEMNNFSARQFVDSLVREMEPGAHASNVQLKKDIADIWLYTDSKLLISVVQNILGNAIRYTPSKGEVLIRTETSDEHTAKLIISDTGQGVASDHLDKIFNEFYQIKTADNQHTKGLGLGLSIVRRICRLLDCPIEVQSTLGEGTTFAISVPMGTKPLVAKVSVADSRHKAPSKRLSELRVLCLDNDQQVLEAMGELLNGWGCEVICVSRYTEALKLLQEQEIAVVIADYRLDFDDTGLDLLRLIHSDSNLAATNGILITAEQDSELKEEVLSLDYQYLAKPVEPAALKSVLLYVVSQSDY